MYAGPAATAPVVLCLHGLMRNSRDFEELAPQLAARYRVIVPDVRGRGLSARDPQFNNYQLPVYMQEYAGAPQRTRCQRVSASSAPPWVV